MDTRRTLITYESISRAIPDPQVLASTALRAEESMESEYRLDAHFLAQFSQALEDLRAAETEPGVMAAARNPVASALQTYLAKLDLPASKVVKRDSDTLEAKFDSNDWLGWAGSFFHWWKRIRPHKMIVGRSTPIKVNNALRVALFSDWGTGLYGAPVCAKQISSDPKGFDIIFHLGDVYYSGDYDEVRERFLDRWPQVSDALNLALNGNHEMYTGGHGYFEKVLPAFHQDASYFALQNDSWVLIGLDSAYADHDLAGDQREWIHGIAQQAGDRKLVLFTHHQPFSLFESQGPALVDKLSELLSARRIYAWYWGHEHRCALYEPHGLWGLRGRCIGHGGFPYFRDAALGPAPAQPRWNWFPSRNMVPGARVLDGANPFVKEAPDKYGPNGFLVLEFTDSLLNESVYDPEGNPLHQAELL